MIETGPKGSTRGHEKTRSFSAAGLKKSVGERDLDLLDEAGLDGFDRDEDALGAAVGGADADLLQVGAEFTLRDAGHVRTDAAALFALTLTVDGAAFGGALSGDCTDSGHDGFE